MHVFGVADAGRTGSAAAAAAQELDDEGREEEGAILLVGPVIGVVLVLVSVGLGLSFGESAEHALGSESVDAGGNDDTDVSAAEAAGAEGSDHTGNGFLGAAAGADHVQGDEGANDGVGDEGVGPSGASLLAVLVAVVLEIF